MHRVVSGKTGAEESILFDNDVFLFKTDVMNIDFDLLVRAFGLCFVLEGLFCAAFPEEMRRVMQQLIVSPQNELRGMGMASIGVGLFVIWLAYEFL